jgi:hypothetical protein
MGGTSVFAARPGADCDRAGSKEGVRLTQREIERARRGAPDRTIRICRDGTLELVPVGEGPPTKAGNEWDDVK